MIRICGAGRQSVLEDSRLLRSWALIQFMEQPFRQPHPVHAPAQQDGAGLGDGHDADNLCDGPNRVYLFLDALWTRAIREVENAHNLGKSLPVGKLLSIGGGVRTLG